MHPHAFSLSSHQLVFWKASGARRAFGDLLAKMSIATIWVTLIKRGSSYWDYLWFSLLRGQLRQLAPTSWPFVGLFAASFGIFWSRRASQPACPSEAHLADATVTVLPFGVHSWHAVSWRCHRELRLSDACLRQSRWPRSPPLPLGVTPLQAVLPYYYK